MLGEITDEVREWYSEQRMLAELPGDVFAADQLRDQLAARLKAENLVAFWTHRWTDDQWRAEADKILKGGQPPMK